MGAGLFSHHSELLSSPRSTQDQNQMGAEYSKSSRPTGAAALRVWHTRIAGVRTVVLRTGDGNLNLLQLA